MNLKVRLIQKQAGILLLALVCLFMGACNKENDADMLVWLTALSLSQQRAPDGWTRPTVEEFINPMQGVVCGSDMDMDNKGNTVIVWVEAQSDCLFGDRYVYHAEYRNGKWTKPKGINDYINFISGTIDYIGTASVAVSDDGSAVIVWNQWHNSDLRMYLYKWEYRNGAWVKPDNLNDYFAPVEKRGNNPQIAADANGNYVLVWWCYNAGTNKSAMLKSEYRSGAWTHPTVYSDRISPEFDGHYDGMDGSGESDGSIQIKSNGKGDFIVMHSRYLHSYYNSTWQHPADINDTLPKVDTEHGASRPNLSINKSGNVLILSREYSSPHTLYLIERVDGVWKYPQSSSDNIYPFPDTGGRAMGALRDSGDAFVVFHATRLIAPFWERPGSQIFLGTRQDGIWSWPVDREDFIGPDDVNSSPFLDGLQARGEEAILIHSSGGCWKSEFDGATWRHNDLLVDFVSCDSLVMNENDQAVVLMRRSSVGLYIAEKR